MSARLVYSFEGAEFEGVWAAPAGSDKSRPLVIIVPNQMGVTDDAVGRAARIAGDRYVGFVADLFGVGQQPQSPPDAMALTGALRATPGVVVGRLRAAINAASEDGVARGWVEPGKIAVVGFCFGGGAALEVARAGDELAAAIAIHASIGESAEALAPGSVKAPVLVLHGSADPVSAKAERDAFEAQMEAAQADWTLTVFGGVLHAFTDEGANRPPFVKYDEPACTSSYRATDQFLERHLLGTA